MNEITTLIENLTFNTETTIRHVIINNEWWFAGIDIARSLEYVKTDKAIKDHVPDHCKVTLGNLTPSKIGGLNLNNISLRNYNTLIMINESGLYRIVAAAKPKDKEKKKRVKIFKNWIYDDVLPTIRKTGQYKVQSENHNLKLKQINLCLEIEKLNNIIEWYQDHDVTKVTNPRQQHTSPKPSGYIPADKEERIKREMQKPLTID